MVPPEEISTGFISLKVTNPKEIGKLTSLIHDEYFEVNDVKYRLEQGTVEIPYHRIFHNGPRRTVRDWLFYKVQEVDVIRSKMLIHHVEEFTVDDPDKVQITRGTLAFSGVVYDPGNSTLWVESDTNLELTMKISHILIESQDLEIRGKSRISFFFFIESTSGRVYY